jgi:spore germination protein KC
MNEDDERKWIGRIESVIQKKMEESLKVMQAKKMDVLGIGNQIYRQNPALWKRWKDDWPNRFEKAEFDIQVHLHITNHGIMTPKPVLLKVE